MTQQLAEEPAARVTGAACSAPRAAVSRRGRVRVFGDSGTVVARHCRVLSEDLGQTKTTRSAPLRARRLRVSSDGEKKVRPLVRPLRRALFNWALSQLNPNPLSGTQSSSKSASYIKSRGGFKATESPSRSSVGRALDSR